MYILSHVRIFVHKRLRANNQTVNKLPYVWHIFATPNILSLRKVSLVMIFFGSLFPCSVPLCMHMKLIKFWINNLYIVRHVYMLASFIATKTFSQIFGFILRFYFQAHLLRLPRSCVCVCSIAFVAASFNLPRIHAYTKIS